MGTGKNEEEDNICIIGICLRTEYFSVHNNLIKRIFSLPSFYYHLYYTIILFLNTKSSKFIRYSKVFNHFLYEIFYSSSKLEHKFFKFLYQIGLLKYLDIITNSEPPIYLKYFLKCYL